MPVALEGTNPSLRKLAMQLSAEIDRSQSPPPSGMCRDHFEAFAEFLPCMIWTAAADGTILYFNQRFRALTGYEGLDYTRCVHPDDVARVVACWQDSVQGGHIYRNHTRLRTADGSYRHIVARATPIFGADGEVAFWIGSATALGEPALEALRAA